MREILGSVTHTFLIENDTVWMQASLPVKLGGLRVNRAVQAAPSAYLASVATTVEFFYFPCQPSFSTCPICGCCHGPMVTTNTVTPSQGLAAFWQKK